MKNISEERMLELLTEQLLFGLNEEESAELKELENLFPKLKNDISLELAASAISLTALKRIEPMPQDLQNKILTNANQFFAAESKQAEVTDEQIQPTFGFEPKRPFLQWLGWAVAGLACIALGISLWTNFQKPREVIVTREVPPPVQTVSDQYNQLLTSAKDLKRTTWTNPKNDKEVLGEIVWSETEQKGFAKFTGLAANNSAQETYQLWIFDETQDEKTPIDGGVFNVSANGEVLIPLKPNLRFKNPKMFAVTVEKPGGVMVSKREKIVAVGKVQI